ncbi:MAG: CU044_5270 family protein [Actinoplanes sp.]
MSEHPNLPAPPTRDLPPGRHEFHKERLMTLIDNDTRPSVRTQARRPFLRRPAFALPALALIVAGAVGVVVVAQRDGGSSPVAVTEPAQFADPRAGTPRGLAQLTNRMALVAATRETGPAPTGEWVYLNSKTTEFHLRENADTGAKTPVAQVSTRQTWMSLDGHRGWLVQSGIDQQDGGETLDSTVDPYLNAPSYQLLASLTTDPDALLARIYAETEGMGNGPDSEAFATIGDLLGESYPPAALYPALYRAAAKIPGVLVVDEAVDAAGRPGIALARVDELGNRAELIFDRTDYTFLGERHVRTTDADGIKAGTVTFSSAVLRRALVDTMKQVPAN